MTTYADGSMTTPARSYAAGTAERAALDAALAEVRSADYDIPAVIGGREVRSGRAFPAVTPHEHPVTLGRMHQSSAAEVGAAVAAAADAAASWGRRPADERAAPFARAAEELAAGPWRERLVAATMLELSKTAQQAEGDVAEVADFIRANIANMATLDAVQPVSAGGVTNHVEYRPLEGFVLAVSPFNFTSMNNLAFPGPARQHGPVEACRERVAGRASVPAVVARGWTARRRDQLSARGRCRDRRDRFGPPRPRRGLLHGLHGHLPANLGRGRCEHRPLSRLPADCRRDRGKDFVIAHPSADVDAVAVACVRGAYEYQGQKCAAVSRVYVPRSLWPALKERMVELTRRLTVGDPTRPGVHLGAVINARQHARHTAALERARAEGVVLVGGRQTTPWAGSSTPRCSRSPIRTRRS